MSLDNEDVNIKCVRIEEKLNHHQHILEKIEKHMESFEAVRHQVNKQALILKWFCWAMGIAGAAAITEIIGKVKGIL